MDGQLDDRKNDGLFPSKPSALHASDKRSVEANPKTKLVTDCDYDIQCMSYSIKGLLISGTCLIQNVSNNGFLKTLLKHHNLSENSFSQSL